MSVEGTKGCYGCGVCAVVCPTHIIEMRIDEYGFLEPNVKGLDGCLNCGLCEYVCSFRYEKPALDINPMQSFAAWNKNSDERKRCSSGGIAMSIASFLFDKGYKACGVRYNFKEHRAEHFVADNKAEYMSSVGSKYLQSFTKDAFCSFEKKSRYVVFGTPCQIDSLRRYVNKFSLEDNYLLVDIFCHGVPSLYIWRKYLEFIKLKIGDYSDVTWRNKEGNGWHKNQRMTFYDDKGVIILDIDKHDDFFYRLFESEKCFGSQCYESCKYKCGHSSSDIRIGDLWGSSFKNSKDGVSAVVVYTQRGSEVMKHIDAEIIEMPFEKVSEAQLHTRLKKDKWYYSLRNLYADSNTTIEDLEREIAKFYKMKQRKKNMLQFVLTAKRRVLKLFTGKTTFK